MQAHAEGELRRSQERVLGAALAVDSSEQGRLRGEMLRTMLIWKGGTSRQSDRSEEREKASLATVLLNAAPSVAARYS